MQGIFRMRGPLKGDTVRGGKGAAQDIVKIHFIPVFLNVF
jgi:hypothetical protein